VCIYIIHVHIHNSHIYIDFIDPYFPLFRRGRVIGCLALSLLDPPKAWWPRGGRRAPVTLPRFAKWWSKISEGSRTKTVVKPIINHPWLGMVYSNYKNGEIGGFWHCFTHNTGKPNKRSQKTSLKWLKHKSSPNGRFTFWGMNSDLENTDGNVRNTSL
jgi:hypothetical protein